MLWTYTCLIDEQWLFAVPTPPQPMSVRYKRLNCLFLRAEFLYFWLVPHAGYPLGMRETMWGFCSWRWKQNACLVVNVGCVAGSNRSTEILNVQCTHCGYEVVQDNLNWSILYTKWKTVKEAIPLSEGGYPRHTLQVHTFDRPHSLLMLLRAFLYCRQQVLQRELEVQPPHSALCGFR